MKILHVNELLGFHGGTERYLHDVAYGFNRRGHGNLLLFGKHTLSDHLEFQGPFLESKQVDDKFSGVMEFLEKHCPDVIFIHRWENFENFLPFFKEIPSFRFVHDHDLYCLRQHKFFYLSGKTCQRTIGARCFLCLPFSMKFGLKRFYLWPSAVRLLQKEFAINEIGRASCRERV